jgi:hypothetical protein
MLAEHLTSEYFIKTEARGRSVDEWKQRPEQPDNHWFDCLGGFRSCGFDARLWLGEKLQKNRHIAKCR